jgi:hypothetical protein
MPTLDGREYSDVDLDAMRRSLAKAMESKEPGRRELFESLLRKNSWVYVAKYASYHVQMRSLGLFPWQSPPANLYGDAAESDALLDRMIAAGISPWEPDIPAALLAKDHRANSAHSNSPARSTQAAEETRSNLDPVNSSASSTKAEP